MSLVPKQSYASTDNTWFLLVFIPRPEQRDKENIRSRRRERSWNPLRFLGGQYVLAVQVDFFLVEGNLRSVKNGPVSAANAVVANWGMGSRGHANVQHEGGIWVYVSNEVVA